MKLLDRLPSIFSAAQRRELEKLLYKDIRDKKIVWRDVLTKAFDDRLVDLNQPYDVPRIAGYSKILPNKIIQKLEDIIIALLSLISESNLIGSLIGKHEMFEKDVVTVYKDISSRFLNMIDNTVKNYKLNMIEVKDGVISMAPDIMQQYLPIKIDTTIFPENVINVSGNDPSPENIFPGTESGYWITSILSNVKCEAGAQLVFDFGGVISFNNIIINSAGKYALTVNKVEVPNAINPTEWDTVNSSNYQLLKTEKKIVLTVISSPIAAKKVRLTLVQPKYDFIWEKTIDNTETYLEGITNKDDDALLEEKGKIINEVLLKNQAPEIVKTVKYLNVYEYILGCYNVSFLLETYSGLDSGIFTSKKYMIDDAIKTVKIITEEYKPTDSTITYEIIQSDDSRVTVSDTSVPFSLTQTFSKSEVFSDITGSIITLSSYPITDPDVKVNGVSYTVVDEFTSGNQCIVKKNKVFFNRRLPGAIINASYSHYTDYVIIRIEMKTNTTSAAFITPKVLTFDVKLNEA